MHMPSTVTWTLRGRTDTFEYWEADDGHRSDVYRRRISEHNVDFEGAPMGVRWECSLGHFNTYPPQGYVACDVSPV